MQSVYPTLHVFLCLHSQGRLLLHRPAQYVSCGYLWYLVPLLELLGLCALSGAWGAQQNESHWLTLGRNKQWVLKEFGLGKELVFVLFVQIVCVLMSSLSRT